MSTPPLHFTRPLETESSRLGGACPPTPHESRIARARQLACEIEDILTSEGAGDGRGYAVRLAQAMARNLLDQLVELERVVPRPLASTAPAVAPAARAPRAC
jgi:hypothetical protein